MSEARAITNLIGNAVATVVIARWDGALDLPHARRVLAGDPPEPVRDVDRSRTVPR
jgi:aerobic C4-dicarboxylate transport protein